MGKVMTKGSIIVENLMSCESPFLLYDGCTYGSTRCNPGATPIEIIDIIETIDTFTPHK
jgi:hypothetical protein